MISIILVLLQSVSAQIGLCLPCRVLMTQGSVWYNNQGGRELVETYETTACQFLFPDDACATYQKHISIVTESLVERFLTSDMCGLYADCPTPVYLKEDFATWQKAILKDKPVVSIPVETGVQTIKFAHISDLHIDTLYSVGASTICDTNTCCRAENGIAAPTAGYWGDYNCDLPQWTFESALQSLYTKSVEFILVTGDFSPNAKGDDSQTTRMNAISVATGLLLKYFAPSTTPVYPVLGNHDCSPKDQFEFGNESWLTNHAATQWQKWLPASAQASFKATGSYTLLHKNTKLRIVAINTFACSNYNLYLVKNSTDPGNQLDFLKRTLKLAETNGEQVYIIGHTAPGSADCLNPWAEHYATLIDRFEGVIRGQFFGGSHHDEFKVNRGVTTGKPVGIEWIAPSMSTFKYRKPSFRIYSADYDTKLVTDYSTYQLDLASANSASGLNPTWDLSYSFKSSYVVSDLHPDTLLSMLEKLKSTSLLMLGFLDNYYTSGPQTPTSCSDSCRNDFYCQVAYGTMKEIEACQGLGRSLQDEALDFVTGTWIYRK